MSWTFQLQKINQSFERIASWYTEFMHRTEVCFRALHERIQELEGRAWQGPTDEQVERALRKILAERFSDTGIPPAKSSTCMKDGDYFVENRKDMATLRPVPLNPAILTVEPDAVPSKAYVDTFRLLDKHLVGFPHTDLKSQWKRESPESNSDSDLKPSRYSDIM